MKLVIALLLTAVAATAAAQSPPRIETSGWKTLRDAELGFEVKHPPGWRVGRSTGTLESVLIGPPAQVGKETIKAQFFVQRDRNPKGLTIQQWHAEELARVILTPGIRFTNTTLGGRAAILMEATNSMGKHFTFFTTAHKSDIFNVAIIQPAERTELDPTHAAVLATLRLLDLKVVLEPSGRTRPHATGGGAGAPRPGDTIAPLRGRCAMRLHLKNARLIDGTGAPPVDGAGLVIEGDTVVHAGRLAKADEPGGDARVVDLAGKTVIPGLIEAHLHLSYNNVKAIADLDLNCPPEYSTLVSAKNAELALACGYTAARSAGSVHAVDVALKRAINEGLYPGPRLLAAGRDICATGGMADWNPAYLKLGMEGLALIADGPEQIRAAVRRVIKDGADVVKCYVGGDALLPHTPIADCTYTLDEVRALVDEAHMRGRMVACHVRGERSSEVAARAGVDSLEHATYANDETLKRIRDAGLTLVPGLRYLYSIVQNGPRFGITEDVIAPTGLRDEIKQAADTYRRAKDLGIRMCPGGDFGFAWNPHGEYAKDIQVFVDVIGFTPLEALTCATKNGAELMRMADRIGTLQPGRLADLVVVDGDPLRDIAILQNRARLRVMKGGVFVAGS